MIYTTHCARLLIDLLSDFFFHSLSLRTSFAIRPEEEQPKVSSTVILTTLGLLPPLLYSQAWFEMVQMRLQKAKANTMEIC